MPKQETPNNFSKEFFLNRPLSSAPPGIDHPRFDYFFGEASCFMKASFSGTSATSLRKLERKLDPLSIAITAWLFAELKLAINA
jgi:hypothetical protein